MRIEVLFFGVLAEKAALSTTILEDIKDIEGLKRALFEKFPSFSEYDFQISVNKSIVHNNLGLKDGDEVALLPPFAGG